MFLMLVQILIGLKVREFIDLNIDIYGFDKKIFIFKPKH